MSEDDSPSTDGAVEPSGADGIDWGVVATFLVLGIAVFGAISVAVGAVSLPGLSSTPELGEENGVGPNATVDASPSDGFTTDEIRQLKNRAMARIELIRGLEYRSDVPIEVVSREEFQSRRTERGGGNEETAIVEQQFEAAFLVNESTSYSEATEGLVRDRSPGFYREGRFVLVRDESGRINVSVTWLVGGLAQALLEQHGKSSNRRANSLDGTLAAAALEEGQPALVRHQYTERCGSRWECATASDPGRPGDAVTNASPAPGEGLLLLLVYPADAGARYMDHQYRDDGWEGVESAYSDPPRTTLEINDPGTTRNATRVRVNASPSDGWRPVTKPFNSEPANTSLGQATLTAMLWQHGVINASNVTREDGVGRFHYTHPITDGWRGDTVAVYRNDGRFGYVFRSRWESPEAARQFLEAYRTLLETNGANRVEDTVYRIPDDAPSGYGDAFRVTRDGATVVVVNAPTADDLDSIRPAGTNDDDGNGTDGDGTETGDDGNESDEATIAPGELGAPPVGAN